MSNFKVCNKCGQSLPLSSFYMRGDRLTPTPRHECKQCHAKAAKAYYLTHKSSHIKASNKYHRLKFYGVTEAQYQQMYDNQKGCCAICGRHEATLERKTLCVDHNHISNKVRGLLCSQCNSMLGMAKDNLTILENAIEYLKKYKEE